MYEVCWYRTNDSGEWIKGTCRALFSEGAIVTPEIDGKLVKVTLDNLWLHGNPPTHTQFGEPEKPVVEAEKSTAKPRSRVH